jgi:hypothetical protein
MYWNRARGKAGKAPAAPTAALALAAPPSR